MKISNKYMYNRFQLKLKKIKEKSNLKKKIKNSVIIII